MSNGSQAFSFIYILLLLVLVGSALAARRIPVGRGLKMAAAWALIFGLAFVAFTFQDDILDFGRRLGSDSSDEPIAVGKQNIRIPQARDGRFWANGQLNGQPARFLVDSGTTITSISLATARRAGIEPNSRFPVLLHTPNGLISGRRARAEAIVVGPIRREDMAVHIGPASDDTDILGMNFLSTLSGWGVEGRFLILRP